MSGVPEDTQALAERALALELARDITVGVGDDRDGWYGAAEARALAREVLRLVARLNDAEQKRPSEAMRDALVSEIVSGLVEERDAAVSRAEAAEREVSRLKLTMQEAVGDANHIADEAESAMREAREALRQAAQCLSDVSVEMETGSDEKAYEMACAAFTAADRALAASVPAAAEGGPR